LVRSIKEIAPLTADVPEFAKEGRAICATLVTIDGEDARDFDDAVYCKNNQRLEVTVAIADVSHYVTISVN
jgi:ribonuclease R